MNYEEIVKKYKTPLFIYNIDTLIDRINYLKSKLTDKYDLVYAVKANTFIAKSIEKYVSRYEICSNGEFNICNNLNIAHNKMVISGVNKDYDSIDNMIKNYDILKYTIESINQFKLLTELSKKYNKQIHVLIRLTSNNQFGVSEDDFKCILKNIDNNYLLLDGIEYFSGTQKTKLERIEKEIDYLIEFTNNIENEFNININEIEYGVGLPVYYYQGDTFNEDEFLDKVKTILDKITNKKVVLELGRSIASSCGSYLTSVVDMKTSKYGNYVIVDGGINHLVYYGQTMAMKIPYYELLPKVKTKDEETYNICGSLCTINDFLVKNIKTRKLNINDIFVFKNTGAYSSTEGINLFLSRDLPKIVLIENNKCKLVRKDIKTSDINFPNYDIKE